jgi:hypothetical protein
MPNIPIDTLHGLCAKSPSLRVTVATVKGLMSNPTPEGVWLELSPFYNSLTVADIKAVWTLEPEPLSRPKPKPGRWPLSLLTRKSRLP